MRRKAKRTKMFELISTKKSECEKKKKGIFISFFHRDKFRFYWKLCCHFWQRKKRRKSKENKVQTLTIWWKFLIGYWIPFLHGCFICKTLTKISHAKCVYVYMLDVYILYAMSIIITYSYFLLVFYFSGSSCWVVRSKSKYARIQMWSSIQNDLVEGKNRAQFSLRLTVY